MTTVPGTAVAGAIEGVRPDFARRTAFVARTFYLITFVASVPAVILLGPVLNDPRYVVSAGAYTGVLWGCFLDTVNALACVGTAVTLFPVVKRQNEATALGFVASRAGSNHHHDRHDEPVGRRHPATGPGRRDRSERRDARHHRAIARSGPRLDVPARTRPDAGDRRPAAGLADVPLPARAPHHPDAGTHRGASAHRGRHRNLLRPYRAGLRVVRDRDTAGGGLGGLPRRVAGREGLPAVAHHQRADRCGTRWPPLAVR